MTPDSVIKTLEAAHITLRWYRDMMPGSVNGSDDETDAQIEAAVEWLRELGVQEPVAKLHDDGFWTPTKTEAGRALNERLLRAGSPSVEVYAAPPAQQPQYEAGDIASASAQGFRDGVASVTQQEPVAWAMPKGDGTFIDVITPAEHAREEGSYTVPLFARPVAQQPQARPDFTDEWTGYLKDGETPFERFLRERKDLQALTKLYQRVLEENERLKAQQPQAEPDIHEAQEQIEFLDKKNNALSAAIRKVMARLADLLDEDQFKEIEEIVSFAGVQPQAEAVPVVDRVYEAAKRLVDHADFQLGGVLSAKSKARDIPSNAASKVKARHLASLRDALAKAPQQAEAVPSPDGGARFISGIWHEPAPQQAEAVPPDVVRDADLALDLLSKLFNAYENGLACYEDPDEQAGYVGNAVELDADTIHACADLLNRRRPIAAIAQQKGQP